MIKYLSREDHLRLQACNGPATCRYSTDPQELIMHSADGNGREIRLCSASFFFSCLSETCRRTCCQKAHPQAFTGLMLGLSIWRVITLPRKFLTLQGSDLQNASSIMTVRGVWKTVSFVTMVDHDDLLRPLITTSHSILSLAS